jgi:hypothetical protein
MCTWMLVSGHGVIVIQLTGFPRVGGGGGVGRVGGSVFDDVHLDARLWSRGNNTAYRVSSHGGTRAGSVPNHAFMEEDEIKIFYVQQF